MVHTRRLEGTVFARYVLLLLFLPLLLTLSEIASGADAAKVSGPVLGYRFDTEMREVQSILGMPGASILGPVFRLDLPLSMARMAPKNDYGLGVTPESELVLLAGWPEGLIVGEKLSAYGENVRQLIFSPSGAAAGVYRDGGRVELYRGLPEAPVVAGTADVSGLAAVGAMALSDDAEVLVVGEGAGEISNVLAFTRSGASRHLMQAGRIAAITFLGESHSIVIADRGRNELLVVRNVDGAPELARLAGPGDAIAAPVSVAATRDGRRVVAVNAGSGNVVVADMESGAVSSVDCGCQPVRVDPLQGYGVFALLSEGGAARMLDAGGEQPRLFRLPAGSGR